MENDNYTTFCEDVARLRKLRKLTRSAQVLITRDNSYCELVDRILDNTVINISQAINSEKLTIFKDIQTDLNRYVEETINALSLRIPDYNLITFLLELNQLIDNWLAMVDEVDSDYKSYFQSAKKIFTYLKELNEILNLCMNTESIMKITERLLDATNKVLAAAPAAFNLSEHFLKALKELK